MDTEHLKEPVKKKQPIRVLNEQEKAVLVQSHTLLIKRIAYHLLGRLPQNIQVEDLMQSGMVGLLEAASHYDESKGASFETYAGIRIRGHMLDEVRRNDWVPRSVYRNARRIAEAVRMVEGHKNREAKDTEIAKALEISLDEYHQLLMDANGTHLYGFDDIGVTDDTLKSNIEKSEEPEFNIQQAEFKAKLTEVIESLPEKERLVLSLYYEHDLNLKDIGSLLDVSESRVSQIHSQATHRIRARIQAG